MGNIKIQAANITKTIFKKHISVAKTIVEDAGHIVKESTVDNLQLNAKKAINLQSESGIKHEGYNPVEPEPVYEEVTTMTLISTFAVEQLQKMAKKDSLILFTYVIKRIYGDYFTNKAVEKFYKDAQANKDHLNPEIIVTKASILGNPAAYNNSTQQILVSKIFIETALQDNDKMGELMVTLVEETGHHIQWLLRNQYTTKEDKAKLRPRRRINGDVGAKFAYQVIHINLLETKEQAFAELTDTTTTYENREGTGENENTQTLIWKYDELHSNLKQYVNEARQNRDDSSTSDDFNFYKAGKIDVAHGEYGHQDIEEVALRDIASKAKYFKSYGSLTPIQKSKVDEILHKIYLGNWLRDFSQVIDPGIVRPLSNAVIAYSKGTDLTDLGNIEKLNSSNPSNRTVKIGIPEDYELIYKGELYSPSTWLDFGANILFDEVKVRPISWSRGFLTNVVKVLALQEFMHPKEKDINKENYFNQLKIFEKEYFDIDEKKLGVYRPDEHIDNPKTVPADKKKNDPKLNTDDKYGFVGSPTKKELSINREYGMKNYIRTDIPVNNLSTKRTAYGYIEQKIKAASKTNKDFKNAHIMADFGAALHVLEDYFAHTNFAEIAAIKVSNNDRVFPWVDQVPNIIAYSGAIPFDYDKFAKLNQTKGNAYLSRASTPSIIGVTQVHNKSKRFNHIARFVPIVTGTFGELDMLASIMPILQEKFFSISITSYKSSEPGSRTINDVLILEMVRDIDKAQAIDGSGMDDTRYEDIFNYLLNVRDGIQKVKKKIPRIIRENAHKIMEYIGAMINFGFYHLIKISASKLGDAQLLLQQQIKDIKGGKKIVIGTDPTHTQIAKDSPHNPIHELSSLLAVHTVKKVGEKMFQVWQGKANSNEVIGLIDTFMQHPAKATWQDKIVEDWCNKNKAKLCKASTPSVVIDSIIHTLEEMKELNEALIVTANKKNKGFTTMQSILEEYDPDGNLITNVKKLLNKNAVLLNEARKLSKQYNKSYYKPPGCS